MAIYHLSVKIIGRSSGRSAVAAAAYRSGECITNDWDGVTHDFRKKNWIEFTEILLPDHAPENFKDRKTLWNAVEAAEKSKSAQLAREFELALPKELPHERQVDLIEKFVKEELVSKGMCVDIAIHNPPKTNDRHQSIDAYGKVTHDIEKMQFLNPHAHVMCTMRPLGPDGKWEAKSQAEYLCRRGQEEQAMISQEYATKKQLGWKKQYQYQTEDKKKVWLSAEEGGELGLKRLSKQPKTTRYGRKNPTIEFWNSEERVPAWRKAWEKAVNESLEKIGSEERVDARSYEAQKLERLPTIHLGVAAVNLEKRANREEKEGIPVQFIKRSDIGNLNRKIHRYNRMLESVGKEIQVLMIFAEDIKKQIYLAFLTLKNHMTINEGRQKEIQKHKIETDQERIGLSGRIEYYETESTRIQKKVEELRQKKQVITEQLRHINYVLHYRKISELKRKLKIIEQNESVLKDYLNRVQKNSGFETSAILNAAKKQVSELELNLEEILKTQKNLNMEQRNLIEEYQNSYDMLPDELKKIIQIGLNGKKIKGRVEDYRKASWMPIK